MTTTTSTRTASDARVRDDRRRSTATTSATTQGTRPNRPTLAMQRRLIAQLVG